MSKVGESPRHRESVPSLRAIFLSPSKVELNVFWRETSAAQSAVAVSVADAAEEDREGFKAVNVLVEEAAEGPATQNGEVLVTQNTSRQQAVTPRLVGRLAKVGEPFEGRVYGFGAC